MDYRAYALLIFFITTSFVLLGNLSNEVSAAPCVLKTVASFYESGSSCAQTNSYSDFTSDIFGEGCAMGYNGTQFYKNSLCSPPTESKWKSTEQWGICKKRSSSNLLAACDASQEGFYDPNVGECAST